MEPTVAERRFDTAPPARLCPVQVVKLDAVELEEGPGRDGFWFRAAPLRPHLGAERIGAGLYEARAGVPIWPYHYHYPTEEWLYVLDGAPVLREAAGRRALVAGDLVCFPPGHRGAHTVEGPGRFVIFSDRMSSGPFVSVYPDSDKVSLHPGVRSERLNALLVPRAAAVDYWHGEGSGEVPPAPSVTREPQAATPLPTRNVHDAMDDVGGRQRWTDLGEALGGTRLDGALLELEPGAGIKLVSYHPQEELWLLAVAGAPAVRHGETERELSPGDLVCLPEGEFGRRAASNHRDEPARLLRLWAARVA
jgi:uncharacterized cupin superfamily protein